VCGRYTVVTKVKAIEKQFNAQFNLPFVPVYNAAPSMGLPVITDADPHQIQHFQWGLVPFWAKDPKIAFKTINARTEEILQKPSFRKPIRSQRCLVLANCYFEWKVEETGKVPHVIYVRDQRLFAMAGIWDQWLEPNTGEVVRSFSILTCPATPKLHPLHHRMPVILSKNNTTKWLSPSLPLSEVSGLFRQYPQDLMNAYPVSTEVNKPLNNSASILEPVGEKLSSEVSHFEISNKVKLEGMGHRGKRPL